MPYRSPGCADVLRGARAHVTDFSYMTLMDKSAVKHNMLKHVDIYGIMILKSIYDKYCCFYEAVLILLNIKASEFHKGRQCHEWRLSVRQRTECS